MNNVQRIQALYAAFGDGDVPAVLGAFDDAIDWHEAEGNPYSPDAGGWVGPQAVLENLFLRLATEWDDFAVHPRAYHDAGATVVVELRYTGTFKATGRALDAQASHVWRFADGRITHFQQYVDTAQMRAVMGA